MRQRFLFGIVSVLSVALAGPVLAQSDPSVPGSTSSSSQASTTSQTQSPSSSTVTGTVVSSRSDELVIDTTSGRQRFKIEAGTSDIPSNLQPGAQVTVEFRTSGGEQQVARVTASPSSSTSMSPSASAGASAQSSTAPSGTSARPRSDDPTMSAQSDVPAGTTRDPSRSVGGTSDDDVDDPSALPATASPLGLVGLLGLLSLGGAAVSRAWRRLL
jgi:hypothetical protein